jgi:hypothetical protein
MATISTSSTLFPAELVADVFSKVKGHSTLAKLSGQSPLPFAGSQEFIFSMDGEASIVGEGANKPAGEAKFEPVIIKPIKFIYQHRLTDEFINMSEEKQIPYMQAFTDGFAKKIARALDIAAIHGVNPADGAASEIVGTNNFDGKITITTDYDDSKVDENLDEIIGKLQEEDSDVTGIAFANAAAAAMGKIKAFGAGTYMYPEFRFGKKPDSFGGIPCDVNNTMAFGSSLDRIIVGDFQNAFKWGYAENVPMEIIQYGDPDGQGDLKRMNQIVLRTEAYLGWGILDAKSFGIIKAANG